MQRELELGVAATFRARSRRTRRCRRRRLRGRSSKRQHGVRSGSRFDVLTNVPAALAGFSHCSGRCTPGGGPLPRHGTRPLRSAALVQASSSAAYTSLQRSRQAGCRSGSTRHEGSRTRARLRMRSSSRLLLSRRVSRGAGTPRSPPARAARPRRGARSGSRARPSSRTPHRPGVAVGAVGVGQLGGRQHRLAVPLRRLARGLGVAAVLALVELDDAVEAVAGIERARAEARAPGPPGCRGRGGSPRPRRDARRRGRAPRGWCRASRRRRGRSGCCGSSAPAPARRSRRRSLGQRDQLEARGGAGVGGEHAPAAGGREDDHAPAARQRLRGEASPPTRRRARRVGARSAPSWRRRRRRRGRRWRASRCGSRPRACPRRRRRPSAARAASARRARAAPRRSARRPATPSR